MPPAACATGLRCFRFRLCGKRFPANHPNRERSPGGAPRGSGRRENQMIRTPLCDLLDIEHPIALGGMGSAASPALVAAVSRAGGLGDLGCYYIKTDSNKEG